MNDILVNALVARIKADMMDLEQVPIPYQEVITELLEVGEDNDI